ncbi:redoxin domain-containing protein [Cohnella fermenti]|uniref:Redoxin domain-containing protein n=1 Tax=Cohnella fermenti TaxID=2565925 RepID=A0A4S4BLH3_9BACL|nr:redoxin domain-containing protein [Cohnella fermenti]THF73178.1 redoxin domain-containing protein [Cohnella fermenti]
MTQQQLQPGMAAPAFRTVDQQGNFLSLEHYRGRKVLLAFMRFSACALCNLRVHRLIGRYPEWQRQGLDVIAVFESPEANLRTHVGAQNAPFPLAADPASQLYDLFGVETSEEKVRLTLADANTKNCVEEAAAAGFALTPEEGSNFHRMPAEFLIDENGIIRLAHYSRLITDQLALEEIDRFAAGR